MAVFYNHKLDPSDKDRYFVLGLEPRSEYPFFAAFNWLLVGVTFFPALILGCWPTMKPYYFGVIEDPDPEDEPSSFKKVSFYFWVCFNFFNNALDLFLDAYTLSELGTTSYAVAAYFGLLIVL